MTVRVFLAALVAWFALCVAAQAQLGLPASVSQQYTAPSGGGSTFALVAVTQGGSTDNLTVTSSSMNDTGANLDIVAVSRGLNASGVLTDSLTGCSSPCNTWVPFASYVNSGGAPACTSNCGIIQIYYCSPCTTGANHVFTVGAAGQPHVHPSSPSVILALPRLLLPTSITGTRSTVAAVVRQVR